MALKATIYKAKISVSNFDIHHYADYALTIAKQPSETEERMMVRLLAYALCSTEEPTFTKGLSVDSEPDLWKVDYGGEILHWIELGQVDERRLRQACGKAKRVTIYTYQDNMSAMWWEGLKDKVERLNNLEVIQLAKTEGPALESIANRNMNLGLNIQDNEIWVTDENSRLCVRQIILKNFPD